MNIFYDRYVAHNNFLNLSQKSSGYSAMALHPRTAPFSSNCQPRVSSHTDGSEEGAAEGTSLSVVGIDEIDGFEDGVLEGKVDW